MMPIQIIANRRFKIMPQFNCRLSQANLDQLDMLGKESGKNRSEVIRELISNGQVKAVDREQNKKVVQGIAELHDQCNQGNLRILRDINNLKNRIDRLDKRITSNQEAGDSKIVVLKIESQLDTLLNRAHALQTDMEGKAKGIVDIQCEK